VWKVPQINRQERKDLLKYPIIKRFSARDGELKIAGHLNYFANSKNFTVLARDGELPCILQLAYGRGKIILVGFNYYLTSKDNYKFFNNIFEKFNIIPYYCWISENDSKVNIFRRTSKNGTFFL